MCHMRRLTRKPSHLCGFAQEGSAEDEVDEACSQKQHRHLHIFRWPTNELVAYGCCELDTCLRIVFGLEGDQISHWCYSVNDVQAGVRASGGLLAPAKSGIKSESCGTWLVENSLVDGRSVVVSPAMRAEHGRGICVAIFSLEFYMMREIGVMWQVDVVRQTFGEIAGSKA